MSLIAILICITALACPPAYFLGRWLERREHEQLKRALDRIYKERGIS